MLAVTPARLVRLALALETARFIGESSAAGARPAYISLHTARFAAPCQLIELTKTVRIGETYKMLQINW
jgi:hypothetical protein